MRSFLLALLFTPMAASGPAFAARAQPAPFANGDPVAGQALADRDCVECHARRFDGDAQKMYTRADRRVHTAAQLATQIAYCNTQLGTSYFPEEEAHVAAYLNQRYYHFEP